MYRTMSCSLVVSLWLCFPLAPAESISAQAADPEGHDILHPVDISIPANIEGRIAQPRVANFYRIKAPGVPRDILEIHVDNRSTKLAPALTIYNAEKSVIGWGSSADYGANTTGRFSDSPGGTFYISVGGGAATTGEYKLSIKPAHAYDMYEPNDDIPHATPIALGRPIEAGIMDRDDVDCFSFRTPGGSSQIEIDVENRSTSLAPSVSVYNASRASLGGNRVDYGANVAYSFSSKGIGLFYVCVAGGAATAGDYTLLVKAKPLAPGKRRSRTTP